MGDSTLTRKGALLIGAFGVLLVLVLWYVFSPRASEQSQPIGYNHKVHVETVGLGCVDCHTSVQSGAVASLPRLEICSNCHSEQPLSDSPEEAKLLDYVAQGIEVPWKRVYRVPDHVYFSHRRHSTLGDVKCETCHGPVAEFTTPVSSPFLQPTMENCMSCHRDNNVQNDCLSCHR